MGVANMRIGRTTLSTGVSKVLFTIFCTHTHTLLPSGSTRTMVPIKGRASASFSSMLKL